MKNHSERKHSKYAASASERWFECPGSVELSEGLPDKPNKYSQEGTNAHELFESFLQMGQVGMDLKGLFFADGSKPDDQMWRLTRDARDFVLKKWREHSDSELFFETRVILDFIDPEMFGTFDAAIVDHFGTLHVFDYKYGAGVAVSPIKNLQMIFYAIGMAARYRWNFKRVRTWIIQPRIRGYDGPAFDEMSIMALKGWVNVFRERVENVKRNPDVFKEGSWCHWCRAKSVCPLKKEAKAQEAKSIFSKVPVSHKVIR